MQDRAPTKPNRYAVYDDAHNFLRYEYHERADEPTQEGDALNKANLLPDEVATVLGLTGNPQVADAFNKISTFGVSKQYFTSSGTFTAPYTGFYFVEVQGGGGAGDLYAGGGGGYAAKSVYLTKGEIVNVTVAPSTWVAAQNGLSSSFGNYLSASGGTAGKDSSGGGGTGVGGDINIRGEHGAEYYGSYQGYGGSSFLGHFAGYGYIGYGYGGCNSSTESRGFSMTGKYGIVIITMRQ